MATIDIYTKETYEKLNHLSQFLFARKFSELDWEKQKFLEKVLNKAKKLLEKEILEEL